MSVGIKFGKLVQEFAILPAINVHTLQTSGERLYDVQFVWLRWFVNIGQISDYTNQFWR